MWVVIKRLLASITPILFIAAFVFYAIARVDSFLGRADAIASESSRHQIRLSKALHAWRARLRTAEVQHIRDARRLGAAADSLTRLALWADSVRADSLRVLGAVDTADPAAARWRDVAGLERASRASCDVAYRTCEQRAASAEAEVDSLLARLTAQLRVRDHRTGLWIGGGIGSGRGGWELQVGIGYRLLRFPFLP
jgi:hypothetical protein